MEKVLNQEEIDAMVRAARGGTSTAPARAVVQWDVRKAGQIRGEQMRSLSLLHEGFARNLTHSLGAYLRIAFEATLASVEHLAYRDFVQAVPEMAYLGSCRLEPTGVTALLQLDLGVAFALLDVLLGGEGKGITPARKMTEIEEQILETVMRIVCRELQNAWHALSLEFQFEQRQPAEQVPRLMSPEDRILLLSFELTLAESRGTLSVVVPIVVSIALLRKIAAEWARPKARVEAGTRQRLEQRLLESQFPAELLLTGARLSVRTLMEMQPGTVLDLRRPAASPATLRVAEQDMFTATVARRGKLRACQIVQPLSERNDSHE